MYWLRSIPDDRDRTMKRRDVSGLVVWSMWQHRLKAYRDLAKADDVWLVERHGRQRWVGWHCRVTDVPWTSDYRSVSEAAQFVESHYGLGKGCVLNHPYTKSKRPNGLLLACQLRPVNKVDIPLPTDLRLDQCGWTCLGETPGEVRRLGLLPPLL